MLPAKGGTSAHAEADRSRFLSSRPHCTERETSGAALYRVMCRSYRVPHGELLPKEQGAAQIAGVLYPTWPVSFAVALAPGVLSFAEIFLRVDGEPLCAGARMIVESKTRPLPAWSLCLMQCFCKCGSRGPFPGTPEVLALSPRLSELEALSLGLWSRHLK